ncbi:ArnT family glycosyltransferase [Pelosinus propionicus]|uniref:4-amino-4-deoxy-L-arabinose transferase n=1 Tax=Pelosinus propionicus DSM 13327 TaxID=1123291 RepID=A0A1I4JX77_9FIRM|nr:glycosyltransferase family 39 protein [Pelosinus propionicus]SFL70716.1 4-amino-4-deoxy-L-arabinose transferase [Pelosinus propionicus DSM 13327]
MNKKEWFEIATIIVIAGFIMFFHLGELPLFDPDEPVYAQTAREMIAAKDLISPRIYGNFWYDKPPMYYWLVAISFKFFGQNEFAARFPSAFFAVCGTLLMYFEGKSIFNNRAGWIAALIAATSIEYFYLGKAAVTDMTLNFFLTASLLYYLKEKYYITYISAGLAILTKGPIGIVLPIIIIVIHLIMTGRLIRLKYMKIFREGFLLLLVSLPWYFIMYYFHGMDFISTFLGYHNIARFLQPEHPNGTLWYYYIPVLAIGFFPWTIFLVQSVWAALRSQNDPKRETLLFLIIWASVVLGFFTLSQTKLVSYILPMYPPLALIMGWYIDKCITENILGTLKKAALIMMLFISLLEMGLFTIVSDLAPIFTNGMISTGIVFAIVLIGTWVMIQWEEYMGFFGVLVVGMVAFVAVLMTQLFPAAVPFFSVKDFVPKFQKHYDGEASLYVAKFYRPGFMYYIGIPNMEMKSREQFADLVAKDSGRIYFIIQKRRYLNLPISEQNKLQLIDSQEGMILLLKDVRF